ncbi:hypothetical protein SUGI_0588340 [Cryptomeria japonica]|nr:hypothetical protein SUGI_0588340 [Cryptomeria japonica]
MGKRGESRSRSRSRGRSYSPSPSPLPRHRRSYDSRDRFRDRCLPFPTCLLVRNIARQTRPEDLRIPFEKFGMVKDVYLPRNYYSGEPRGFGFVKYANPDDAAEAKHYMNHQVINGREISIVFAEENRKNPDEMRLKSRKRSRYGGGSYRRHTPPRSPRWRRSYSHSESPPYRSTSIFCDRNSHSSNSRSHDSPPFLNRPRDSLSPRGRTHYSPPLRRISRDSSLPRDRLCNSSPLRSKYCDSPPSRNREHRTVQQEELHMSPLSFGAIWVILLCPTAGLIILIYFLSRSRSPDCHSVSCGSPEPSASPKYGPSG